MSARDETRPRTQPIFAWKEKFATNGPTAIFGEVERNFNQVKHSKEKGIFSTESQSSAKSFNRPSVATRMAESKAKKVRFYRNGDKFFKGMIYAVSINRFRTFENLLTSLTTSALCDRNVMPKGVRHVFSINGTRKIDSLDQLEDGQSYVCASTETFRNLDYSKNEDPTWNAYNSKKSDCSDSSSYNLTEQTSGHSKSASHKERTHTAKSHNQVDKARQTEEKTTEEKRQNEEYLRSFIVPRLITVIKQGKKPRKSVRLLLNRKTAQNFEQVLSDISDAIKMECGSLRKIYSMGGRRVNCLADFFQDDLVFIAYGFEKPVSEDFLLDKGEVRQVSAYRPFAGKIKERVTLRNKASEMSKKAKSMEYKTTIPKEVAEDTEPKTEHTQLTNSAKDDTKFDITQVPTMLTKKYDIGSLIGTGNFAVVLECRERKTNKKFALKIIDKDSCKGKEKMIDNEVRILRCVRHPNIIRLVEDFSFRSRIFFIMELVKGGDLFDAISLSTKYTEQDAGGMLYNLASALEYLHNLHIVHRDVKPENILIRQHEDGTKSLKLGDFGLATEVKGPLFTVCGTPTYVAPEVIAETGYGLKVDVWSAGVIAYILLCGFPPFSSANDNQDELFDMILAANYEFPSPYWDHITKEAKTLISQMLEINADVRLDASQVLEHPWVAQSDVKYEEDLQHTVAKGLSTHFRRTKHNPKSAGINIMATTALDKSSRFFQGRGLPTDKHKE